MPGSQAELRIAIRAINEAKAALKDVEGDLASLRSAAEQTNGRVSALGGAMGALGDSMRTVGAAAMVGLAGGLAAVGGGLVSALRASGDFEKQLNIVASVAGATGAELEGLKRTALDLGQSTAFSAGEVAQAMEVLAANGIATKDIIDGAAKAALDLAAAGSTSLVQAADTVSTAMAVWNLSTDQLTDTVNRLAGAANVSRFGVEDMSLAIAQGGGAASAAGVEFADFAGAIATIAPLFASGSDAGTSFKTFIQRLVPDTKAAKEAFMELGFITADGANVFFDATGTMRPMAEVVGEIHKALSRLSEEDRTRLLSNAFGTDAMRTVIGLGRLTREEFEALTQQMGEASAADIGQARMQGLAGAMEQVKGALETARIEIGDRLNPVMTRFFDWLAGQIPRVTEGVLSVFDRLSSDVLPRLRSVLEDVRAGWERIREPVMQFLGSSEAAQIGLGLLAAVLLSVAVAAGSAGAAMLAAVAPVAALGLAIGGILIVADKLGVDWGKVWDGVKAAAERVVDAVVPRIEAFASTARELLGRFASYWETDLRPALERVSGWVQAALDKVLPIIQPIVGSWAGAFRTFLETATTVIGQVLEIIGRLVDIVVQLINGDWLAAWNSAKELVKTAIDLIGTILSGFIDTVLGLVGGILDAGKRLIGALLDGAVTMWTDVVWPWYVGLGEKILSAFAGAGEWLLDIGKAIMNGLLDGLKAAWEGVSGWLSGVGDKIKSIKGPPEKDSVLLYDIGRMIMQGLERGMFEGWSEDVVKTLKSISRGLVRNYEDAVGDLETHVVPDYRRLGEVLTEALANGYFDGFRKNKPLLEQVARELTSTTAQMGADVGRSLELVFDTTGKNLEQLLGEVREMMLDNLQSGTELTSSQVRTLLEHLSDLLESSRVPEDARALGERVISELLASLEAGKGAANAVIADLAETIAKKLTPAGSSKPAEPPPGITDAGMADWNRSGGKAPTGAHGVELVWDPQLKAWVYPWDVGAFGTQAQWRAAQEQAGWWGGPPVRTEVVVQVDGREVASAVAETSSRQTLAWGVQ